MEGALERATLGLVGIPLPSVDELIERSTVVSIPLVRPFRGLTHREVMVFLGTQGPGEWAAFTEYDDSVATAWLRSALEQAFDPDIPQAPADIDVIRVNATFPALSPADVPGWWERFPGVASAKVKVGEPGQALSDDIARVKAIRDTAGPDVSLRLDANARWSLDQAHDALMSLARFDIDYVEQPVATIDEMVALKRLLKDSGIRLAADELIRQHHSLDEVIASQAADIAVVKVSPLGGINRALEVARQAHAGGLEVVVSSALETSVGLSWGVRAAAILASEFGGLPDSGLGTGTFLQSDVVTSPLSVSGGAVAVCPPELDAGKVKAAEANPSRTAWWIERLRRCHSRLDEERRG